VGGTVYFYMPDFKTINKKTIPSEIIQQIVSLIRNGDLKPGDRLPSEKKLTELFNVGRTSIREALQALEAVNLIRKENKGKIVCDPGRIQHSGLWLSTINSNIREVFETRKLFEIELAGLAAKRAGPENIEEMEKNLVETDNNQELIASDISFHQAIVQAAKNSVLSHTYTMITGLLFQSHKYYSLMEQQKPLTTDIEKIMKDHKKILRAIESHDAEAAKEAMKEHLDDAERTLLGKVGQEPAPQTISG